MKGCGNRIVDMEHLGITCNGTRLRISVQVREFLYGRISLAAAASGVSLNSFITGALKEHLESVNAQQTSPGCSALRQKRYI